MLQCLRENETTLILTKVHKGVCDSHTGGRALAHKLHRVGIILAYSYEGYNLFC